VLLALAANLWLAGWWLVALLATAALVLPLGWACAALVVATLAVLGLEPEAVALAPFGPSQAGRFYGLSNLLSTWLLLPAVLGVALLARRSVALAGALALTALVAVGGNRFGADGGGLLVLLAAYGTLALRLAGVRLTAVRVLGLGVAVAVAGVALVGLDAALGGSSHVTDALGGGPGALLGDLSERLELSWRRATGGLGPVAATLAGLGGLVWVGTRRPRLPASDAILVAVVVSLLVNDTPTDVAAVGGTVAFLVRRFEAGSPSTRPIGLDRLRAMRRTTVAAATLVAALGLALAGCSSGEEVGATPETVVGEVPTQEGPSAEDLPALELTGDAAAGEEIWTAQGCGACHTMSAAGSAGNVGPNLDETKPSYELVVQRVTQGQGGMPAFGDKLEPQQIADVSQYVVDSTGG
jgi:mono/diheme cytochrome c family protein